jgi:hypothetical protein
VEEEDFTIGSVFGPTGTVTYEGVSTLSFSENEFVGFLDFEKRAMIQEITDNSMRLVMFAAVEPDYAPLNTNALVLTFEVVK